MKNTIAAVFFLALAGCGVESTRLGPSQLEQLFSVERVAHIQSVRFSGNVVLKRDKTALLKIPALGNDRGIWWIDGDKLCSKWKQAIRGKAACAHVTLYPDGTYAGHDPTTGLRLGTFSLNK